MTEDFRRRFIAWSRRTSRRLIANISRVFQISIYQVHTRSRLDSRQWYLFQQEAHSAIDHARPVYLQTPEQLV